MNTKTRTLALAVSAALTLAACGGDDSPSPAVTDPAAGTSPVTEGKLMHVYVTDHEGHVNVFADSGTSDIPRLNAVQLKNSAGQALHLGEILFNKNHAFVVVESGMTDVDGHEDGGALAVIPVDKAATEHALDNTRLIPLHASHTDDGMGGMPAMPTRLSHAYPQVDADGHSKYLWVENDAGSIFRVNWDPTDNVVEDFLADDIFAQSKEIAVGKGHKKTAVTAPNTDQPNILPLVITHNAEDRSLSVIDNNPASDKFLQVVSTVDLGANNMPHGITFSPHSGFVYTGIMNDSPTAMVMLDARSDHLEQSFLSTGVGVGQLPASGAVQSVNVAHPNTPAGRWVLTVGYKPDANGGSGQGYLSVIDAHTNAVVESKPIGDTSADGIYVAHLTIDNLHRMRVFLPSNQDGADKNIVTVMDLDPTTGTLLAGSRVDRIAVGHGTDHRMAALSPDFSRLYVSNGGECPAEHEMPPADDHTTMEALNTGEAGSDCTAVSVIDTVKREVVATINTHGPEPGSIAVVEVQSSAPAATTPATGGGSTTTGGSDGHNHTH